MRVSAIGLPSTGKGSPAKAEPKSSRGPGQAPMAYSPKRSKQGFTISLVVSKSARKTLLLPCWESLLWGIRGDPHEHRGEGLQNTEWDRGTR